VNDIKAYILTVVQIRLPSATDHVMCACAVLISLLQFCAHGHWATFD